MRPICLILHDNRLTLVLLFVINVYIDSRLTIVLLLVINVYIHDISISYRVFILQQ